MSVFGAVRRAVVACGRGSQEAAVANARMACTDLSRRRVERAEVEAFLALAWPQPAAATGRRTSRA
ncbi:MAG: hypothetical protein HOV66_25225 [Streptomycetaceae bacterium]|nr:hypothetical protein [Streptomycetaceae bacterium]